MEKYYTLLTDTGLSKITQAHASGTTVKLTQMAVGDGGGQIYNPSQQQTELVNEVYRAELNNLYVDATDNKLMIAEMNILANVGGWYIREAGLFDEDGDMIAIAKVAETYKPQLDEGSSSDVLMRIKIVVSNADSVTLEVDPATVLATRDYVDVEVLSSMDAHITHLNPHTQYQLLNESQEAIERLEELIQQTKTIADNALSLGEGAVLEAGGTMTGDLVLSGTAGINGTTDGARRYYRLYGTTGSQAGSYKSFTDVRIGTGDDAYIYTGAVFYDNGTNQYRVYIPTAGESTGYFQVDNKGAMSWSKDGVQWVVNAPAPATNPVTTSERGFTSAEIGDEYLFASSVGFWNQNTGSPLGNVTLLSSNTTLQLPSDKAYEVSFYNDETTTPIRMVNSGGKSQPVPTHAAFTKIIGDAVTLTFNGSTAGASSLRIKRIK